jgi:hypothetical protein
MKRKLLFTICLLFALSARPLHAIEDPLKSPNNKFGIHLHDENDLQDAYNLVNSNGGDWGYVTLVIREEERDLKRWQQTFDKMRALHLIPLVRIASNPKDAHWQKGNLDLIDDWVSLLKNLTWVTKNRYVMIGNEPNHASEWGSNVNPEEYSDYLLAFSTKLKEASPDFFVLPGGLDASAPNDEMHMDEALFLERMIKKNPTIFNNIDGWNSHSYPNPGFAGSETDTGRGSIRTYEWEMELLKKLGVTKTLPIFITETGWVHPIEDDTKAKARAITAISDKLKFSFEEVWKAPSVVAVTPFIINYQSPPFDTFSWKKKDGTFYQFYTDVQSLSKTRGEPIQENKGEIQTILLPEVLTINEKIYGVAYIKNSGQKIWNLGNSQEIQVEDGVIEINPANPLSDIKPGETGTVFYRDISKEKVQSQSQFDTIVALQHVPIAQR